MKLDETDIVRYTTASRLPEGKLTRGKESGEPVTVKWKSAQKQQAFI